MRTWFISALFAVIALSGCVSEGSDDPITQNGGSNVEGQFVGENLTVADFNSDKPSLNPHPAYGYPTPYNYSGLTVDVPEAWTLPSGEPGTISGATSMEFIASTEGAGAGAGIFVFGHYVLASGNGPGHIVDIADPMNPIKVASFETGIRDADLIMHPDGTLTAVMASSGPIRMWDITNPTNITPLPDLEVGSHNAAVVPGTPIVYNANSAGGDPGNVGPLGALAAPTGITEIFDVTDPNNPVRLPDFQNGYGCHDITFWITDLSQRAYCAGIEMTQIWDIADPINPVVLVNIPVHHGVAGTPSASVPITLFSHLAMVNHAGNILIVGDESGGGLANACDLNVDAQAQTLAGPTGNLWFYDISNEESPQLLSMMNPNNPILNPTEYAAPAGCTAHFGRIVGTEDTLVMSFYGAGVILVDFSNPSNPVILDQYMDGTSTWDVWEWQGYLYTGDLNKGVEVLKLN